MKEFIGWSSIFSTLSFLGFIYIGLFSISSCFRRVEGEGYSLLAVLFLLFLSGALLVFDLVLRIFIKSQKSLNLTELVLSAVVVGLLLWI